MAKAEKVTIHQPTYGVRLELTMEEAQALRNVFGNSSSLDLRDSKLLAVFEAVAGYTEVSPVGFAFKIVKASR